NPPGYGIISGLATGARGRRLNGLVTKAPKSSHLTAARASGAKPSVPAAFIRGVRKVRSRLNIFPLSVDHESQKEARKWEYGAATLPHTPIFGYLFVKY